MASLKHLHLSENRINQHVSRFASFQRTRFRNSRQSRFEDFYDVGDGDWGWINTNLDHDGEQFFQLEIPETPDDFYFNVKRLKNIKAS